MAIASTALSHGFALGQRTLVILSRLPFLFSLTSTSTFSLFLHIFNNTNLS